MKCMTYVECSLLLGMCARVTVVVSCVCVCCHACCYIPHLYIEDKVQLSGFHLGVSWGGGGKHDNC